MASLRGVDEQQQAHPVYGLNAVLTSKNGDITKDVVNFLEDLAKSYSSDGLRRQLDVFLRLPREIYAHGHYQPSVGTGAGPIYELDG